ncbi:hypothetical protein P0L94_01225 [Microbacter sp. GSS18]|nr:hypothetical protein P0L94_01225 [Microbacter sp. GSS18]
MACAILLAATALLHPASAWADGDGDVAYWSLFNAEEESAASAVFVTYVSLDDMVNDENRVGLFFPDGNGFGQNIVGAGSDGSTFWSLFNAEEESAASAVFVTYGSLDDMVNDENRVGLFFPDGNGFGQNIVGAGSDGSTFWSLFNAEEESAASAVFVTYGSLDDMVNDENRVGLFFPDGNGFGQNIVGAGSDGSTFWSLFNAEEESAASAVFVTYGSLDDMVNDENRVGLFFPDGNGFGQNIVGTGAGVPLSAIDSDGDGVSDAFDLCPGTVLGEADEPPSPKKNRFWADDAGEFVDATGSASGWSIEDTAGCSAAQIIEAAGLGQGHTRFGITRSALEQWAASAG